MQGGVRRLLALPSGVRTAGARWARAAIRWSLTGEGGGLAIQTVLYLNINIQNINFDKSDLFLGPCPGRRPGSSACSRGPTWLR